MLDTRSPTPQFFSVEQSTVNRERYSPTHSSIGVEAPTKHRVYWWVGGDEMGYAFAVQGRVKGGFETNNVQMLFIVHNFRVIFCWSWVTGARR